MVCVHRLVVLVSLLALLAPTAACPRLSLTREPNVPPVVVVDDDIRQQTVAIGSVVVLRATATDADDDQDALGFQWSQLPTDPIQLPIIDAKKATASVVAPSVAVTLNFLVVANDGIDVSDPQVVTVTVEVPDNARPTALAVNETLQVVVGAQVALDGTPSTDPEADPLQFQWSQVPDVGLPVNLQSPDTAVATFNAPATAGTLFFQLVVTDGVQNSLPFTVRVDVGLADNATPVAVGNDEDIAVFTGATVVLDGSDSIDDDGDALTFLWRQIDGDPVNLQGADTAVASFTAPPTASTVFFELVVDDGTVPSVPFVVRVDVAERPNLPPVVVVAEALIEADAGATVVLNGGASTDPEGRPLAFRWEQVISGDDIPVNVLSPLSSSASFTAPDETTRLFFRLFVDDGVNTAPPAVVQVDVFVPPNIQPVARVSNAERTAIIGTTVVLDGGLSLDADADPLSFRWTQVAGAVALAGLPATTSSFTFTAPAEATRLVFELVVDDGLIQSVPAVVIVDVTLPPNTTPVARMVDGAGALVDVIRVQGDAQVGLDGTGSSDADGDALSFEWRRIDNGVPVNLSPPSGAAVATFRAPDLTTTMFFALTVNDGRADSVPHVVRVEITQRENLPPVVDLSRADQVVAAEAVVILDARASTDPEGRTPSFRWVQVDNGDTPVNITAATSSVASFIAPDKDAELIFRLTVSDGVNETTGIFTVIVAQDVFNLLPAVTPIADPVVVQTGQIVQLRCGQGINTPNDGEDEDDDCRDPDGTIVSFKWSLQSAPAGGAAVFSPPQANIRAPTVRLTGRGTYFLALTATDDLNDTSLPQLVRIDVVNSPPVASVPPPDTTENGAPITLVGGGVDADGDVLSFRWSLIDNPDGGRVALQGATTAAVSFTPTAKTPVVDPAACVEGGGCYQLQLVVSDGREDSEPVTVFVTVTDREPVANAGVDNDGDVGDIVLDGRFSFDPDGDTITTFTWTQTLGPDLGTRVFSGRDVRIVAPAQSLYEFELVVTAAGVFSAPDRVRISIDNINSVPVLSTPSARFVVGEGALATFAVQISDLDDAVHEVEWTKVTGSSLFPGTLLGATPNLVGPPYLLLLDAPEGSSATYDVVARDPQGASSNTIRVEIFAGPGIAQFVVLHTGPGSSTLPGCGTVSQPCATLAAAIAVVDANNDTVGDGRDFIFTTEIFNALQARIPSGTSLLGGRDPSTFTIAGDTELLHDGGVMTQTAFLLFGSNAQDAVMENMTVRFVRPLEGDRQAVQCDGCTLTIRDSTIISQGSINHAAVRTIGAASLVVERCRIEIRGCRDNQDALALAGSSAIIRDTDVFVAASNQFGRNNPVTLSAGSADLERNRLIINGDFTFNDTNGIRVAAGTMRARNNFIFVGNPGEGAAISQASGSGSYFNNSLVGTSNGRGDAGAIEAAVPVALMNNYIAGFTEGVRLLNAGSKTSTIYGNVFDSTGTEIECPGVNNDVVNAQPSTLEPASCNATTAAWTDNQVASCPLVDALTGDLHLNGALANPCRDAGLTSSPAGVADLVDIDGQTRIAPFDVGADEL
jgi:hypothetical protein